MLNTSELYLPSSGKSYRIPGHNKISQKSHPTLDNLLLCGKSDCLMWSSITGSWNETIAIQPTRTYHVSWIPSPEIGTYLIGGVNFLGKVTRQASFLLITGFQN